MKVLVACEFSGIVRDAFAARGHDAWSCDLLPSERPGQHIQGDVLLHLADGAILDLCHIEQLFPDWMAGRVYWDPKTCDRMDLVFVPYALITRVTFSLPSIHERRIGFQTSAPSPT